MKRYASVVDLDRQKSTAAVLLRSAARKECRNKDLQAGAKCIPRGGHGTIARGRSARNSRCASDAVDRPAGGRGGRAARKVRPPGVFWSGRRLRAAEKESNDEQKSPGTSRRPEFRLCGRIRVRKPRRAVRVRPFPAEADRRPRRRRENNRIAVGRAGREARPPRRRGR